MTETAGYAEAVVRVLREHFPGLADPVTAEIVTTAINRQAGDPEPMFEVIVDDPISARWRLKPDSRDRRRVRLACYRETSCEADSMLERAVNEALQELDVTP